SPDLASSRLVASPNPLDEPIIRAHGVTPVLSVMCAAPFPSLRSRAGERRPSDDDSAVFIPKMVQFNPHLRRRKVELLSPLDEHDGPLVDQVFEAERRKVPRTLNPIKVHVVDLALAAVLVHQRERRTGDL